MNAKGTLLVIDLYGAPAEVLNDAPLIEGVAREVADRVGAQVLESSCHQLAPQGVIVVLTLSQSHLSIHTWPETGYAAVDLFFCTHEFHTELSLSEMLCERIGAARFEEKVLLRGMALSGASAITLCKETGMKMVKGIYENGIVRTLEDPHLSGRQEVIVLFPESTAAATRPWIGVPASELAPLVGMVSLGGNALEDTEGLYDESGDPHDSGR